MSKIWSFIITISIIVAIVCGDATSVTNIIMDSGVNAVNNIIKLVGMLCFWSGIFNILSKTTLVKRISKYIGKLLNRLFDKKYMNEKAMEDISLNVTCNVIGVGNAATVYGIRGIEELNKLNTDKKKANNNMSMFVLLNTASLQLIPTGMIAMRAMYNSQNVAEIVVPVWIVTGAALLVGIVSCKITNKLMP